MLCVLDGPNTWNFYDACMDGEARLDLHLASFDLNDSFLSNRYNNVEVESRRVRD